MTGTSQRGVLQDLSRNALTGRIRPGARAQITAFLTLRYASVCLLRIAQRIGRYSPLLAGVVKQLNQLVTGADVAWQAQIGPGLIMFHPVGVVIGPGVRMGANCTLQQGITLGGDGVAVRAIAPSSPILGDDVIIGAGARLIGAIRVDDGCIVGANAVVTRPSPGPGMVAVGVPAVWRRPQSVARDE